MIRNIYFKQRFVSSFIFIGLLSYSFQSHTRQSKNTALPPSPLNQYRQTVECKEINYTSTLNSRWIQFNVKSEFSKYLNDEYKTWISIVDEVKQNTDVSYHFYEKKECVEATPTPTSCRYHFRIYRTLPNRSNAVNEPQDNADSNIDPQENDNSNNEPQEIADSNEEIIFDFVNSKLIKNIYENEKLNTTEFPLPSSCHPLAAHFLQRESILGELQQKLNAYSKKIKTKR